MIGANVNQQFNPQGVALEWIMGQPNLVGNFLQYAWLRHSGTAVAAPIGLTPKRTYKRRSTVGKRAKRTGSGRGGRGRIGTQSLDTNVAH